LSGVDAVVDWFRSGALRPFLDPLDPREREEFLDRYQRDLADAYDVDPDGGLLFLYPRLFMYARKSGGKR
jgi:trans-aconitate 2-methyltransferase